MTYCLGIKIKKGIVMVSDSRTSAGVDNVSSYSKMWRYGVPGERQFILCSAGNLATTQSVIAMLERDVRTAAPQNLHTVTDMNEASDYIGRLNIESQKKNTGGGAVFETTFLLGGEILGAPPGLYMIYSQGNFIASSTQVPFLQIGEIKYGKPILDRVVQEEMSLDHAAVCGLISMDATLKSNLTVGPPIELAVLDAGLLQPPKYQSFDEENTYMRDLRLAWNKAMQDALFNLQPPNWT